MNTGTLITQSLLLALDLYRTHNGLASDWVPSEEDWDNLTNEVELSTAQKFKDDAKASVPIDEQAPAPEK